MPSHDLFLYFQNDVTLLSSSFLSGKHYALTLAYWLRSQDAYGTKGLADLERDATANGHAGEGSKTWYRLA